MSINEANSLFINYSPEYKQLKINRFCNLMSNTFNRKMSYLVTAIIEPGWKKSILKQSIPGYSTLSVIKSYILNEKIESLPESIGFDALKIWAATSTLIITYAAIGGHPIELIEGLAEKLL